GALQRLGQQSPSVVATMIGQPVEGCGPSQLLFPELASVRTAPLLRDAGCELALLWPDHGPDDDAVIGTAIREKGRFAEERQICTDYDIVKLLGSKREAIGQFCGFRMPTETEWARDKRCINTAELDERIAKSVGI